LGGSFLLVLLPLMIAGIAALGVFLLALGYF
jgi:hypothetical protein